ncbi:unnamed protein product [Paramecium pentaurelia]|uniref:Uncharacterized protein n=1 Tax=Paramecium pentaurelia TaxID=43138 RepID=A0A8S1XT60_9CILI|nr:unnamed protein product [Paramecium pentaurelia]
MKIYLKLEKKKYYLKLIFWNLILYTSYQKYRRSILLQDKSKILQVVIERFQKSN